MSRTDQILHECDVAIAGAGPAGASAAQILSRSGLNVVILEKANPPRYKTCGGGILARAGGLIGDIPQSITEHACHAVQFALSSQLQFTASRSEPMVRMTMRDAFDNWLTQQAISQGAHLLANHVVRDLTDDGEKVGIITNRGEVRARYVIAADGANSLIARRRGWPVHRNSVPAVECEVAVSPQDFARLGQSARFDFHVIAHGYAWVFPKKSHLSIGVLSFDSRVNLNQSFTRYLEYLGIASPISIDRHGYVIPLSPRHHTLARDRVFLTGDAAGLADPVTAEGITGAILSGQLAARAIVENFSNADRACEKYNAALHREILGELLWARRLAAILYQMPRCRNMIFRVHGQRLAELMADIVTGATTYKTLLTKPANYLRLLKF